MGKSRLSTPARVAQFLWHRSWLWLTCHANPVSSENCTHTGLPQFVFPPLFSSSSTDFWFSKSSKQYKLLWLIGIISYECVAQRCVSIVLHHESTRNNSWCSCYSIPKTQYLFQRYDYSVAMSSNLRVTALGWPRIDVLPDLFTNLIWWFVKHKFNTTFSSSEIASNRSMVGECGVVCHEHIHWNRNLGYMSVWSYGSAPRR